MFIYYQPNPCGRAKIDAVAAMMDAWVALKNNLEAFE